MLHSAQCARMNWVPQLADYAHSLFALLWPCIELIGQVCQVCKVVLPMQEQASHVHCPHCPLVQQSEAALVKHVQMVAPRCILLSCDKSAFQVHDTISCSCGIRTTMDQMLHHKKHECSQRHVVCRFCGRSAFLSVCARLRLWCSIG